MFAIEIQTQLNELQAERALASFEGLTTNDAYMTDLEVEIEATRHAYIATAVTEIAQLRADLCGPQLG